MRLLLFGKNGQLGWELQRSLACLGPVTALDYPEVDFTRPDSLKEVVIENRPEIIINPAAYTAVDKAETETDLADRINHQAVRALAEIASDLRIPLIHFSTDYVFDGTMGGAYDESDSPHPINVYGNTKLAGENAIWQSGCVGLVFRTSWVYSMREGGFVTKVLTWAHTQEVLRIVDDQVSCPTSARLLAEIIALLLAKAGKKPNDWLSERAGLYHLAGDGACSRYEWAKQIIKLDPGKVSQTVREILPAKSSEFVTPAMRPLQSILNCDKFERAFGLRLPSWLEGLKLTMDKVYGGK